MMELLNEFLSGSVAWGVLLTLAAFALGALVNRVTGKAFFNPLLLGAIFVIVFLSVCGIPYADYKVSAAPVNYLLLPATVALAIPLYEKLAGTGTGAAPDPGAVRHPAAQIRDHRHQHGCSCRAGRHCGPDRCHRHPDGHCGQPAGRDGLQGVSHHRPHCQGRGHWHLGPCRGHQQGPADG